MSDSVPPVTEPTSSAGGVVRRRRTASNKRRSPSGSRRRPQTPEPRSSGEDLDDGDTTPPVKAPRAKSKQRSSSSTGDNRHSYSASESEEGVSSSITLAPTDDGYVVTRRVSGADAVADPKTGTEERKVSAVEVSRGRKRGESNGVKANGKEESVESNVTAVKVSRERRDESKGERTNAKDADGESKISAVKASREKRDESKSEKRNVVEESVDSKVSTVKVPKEKPEEIKDESIKEPKVIEKIKVSSKEVEKEAVPVTVVKPKPEAVWRPFLSDIWKEWRLFKKIHHDQNLKLRLEWNKCLVHLLLLMIYCGAGGLLFRFTEGAFESFYKCGVKRVKRDFIDALWAGSHNLREDDWKSQARRKMMEFEEQLHTAHEAGVHTYSGQRSWTFLNAVVYCITVVTTIGYGDISPSTTTGRAVTILYAIFGIPMFLILLADFGKLFTRGIKFLWAFVRRLYYTGSCRKVRRTGPVQEVMKGVQLVYDFAINRRPSQMMDGEGMPPLDGSIPGTPALSNFEVDDEFNLPISVAIVVLLIYIFVGAIMFSILERWEFFDSFYFVFISMSTIGFGDFVPKHPISMLGSIVYLVFGLALTSMCINVVQEKLSASFQQASAKIGATIGLRLAQEEEAAMTASLPLEVELPEVHQPSPGMKKSQSGATKAASTTVDFPDAQLLTPAMKKSQSS